MPPAGLVFRCRPQPSTGFRLMAPCRNGPIGAFRQRSAMTTDRKGNTGRSGDHIAGGMARRAGHQSAGLAIDMRDGNLLGLLPALAALPIARGREAGTRSPNRTRQIFRLSWHYAKGGLRQLAGFRVGSDAGGCPAKDHCGPRRPFHQSCRRGQYLRRHCRHRRRYRTNQLPANFNWPQAPLDHAAMVLLALNVNNRAPARFWHEMR